jgi:hypothetical protein
VGASAVTAKSSGSFSRVIPWITRGPVNAMWMRAVTWRASSGPEGV